MGSSSVFRFIWWKGILRRNECGGGGGGRRMMSSNLSPWVMLAPTLEKRRGGGMVYNFYSFSSDEVLRFNKYGGGAEPISAPDDDARVVGSSHGWLALMNRRNNDLFLSNPLSRRHIKLPPVEALPHPEFNLRWGGRRGLVSKVIVSASPDDADCRAIMSFGPGERLAFCRPGRSSEWIPIGQLFLEDKLDGDTECARVYEDFVYSKRRNLLNCLTISDIDDITLEDWDLRDSDSPRIDWIQREKSPSTPLNSHHSLPKLINCGYEWLDDDKAAELRRYSIFKHLVYAEDTDELFLLFRFINGAQTVSFLAAKVIKEKAGKIRLVGTSLEGLSLFVGTNHSFAVAGDHHLKPNSIYFTDNKFYYTPFRDDGSNNFEGGDIGIFNCADGCFSSCYYPRYQRIVPAPIWFNPTLS